MGHTYFPEILWAQRSNATDLSKNIIYLTVNITDSEKPQIKLSSTSLQFDSKSDDDSNEYKFSLDFFEEIDVEKSREHQTGRGVFFVLQKKTAQEEFWPRLTKEKKKFPFIKTDFDKWVDEDEQDEKTEDYGAGGEPAGMGDFDFSKMAGGFPGMGGGAGGMPDLSALQGLGGGAGGMPDLSALQGLGGGAGGMPDLSALQGLGGGAGGMPDLSAGAGAGAGAGDEEEVVETEKVEEVEEKK